MSNKRFTYEPLSVTLTKGSLKVLDVMSPGNRSAAIREIITEYFARILMEKNIEPTVRAGLLRDRESLEEWTRLILLAENGAEGIRVFRSKDQIVNVIQAIEID